MESTRCRSGFARTSSLQKPDLVQNRPVSGGHRFWCVLVLLCLSLQVMAFELPLLSIGPTFRILTPDENDPLQTSLREALIEQRGSDPEFKLYSTTERIARAEVRTLDKLLRAKGYYQSQVQYRIDDGEIDYEINPGPRYTIIRVRYDVPTDIQFESPTPLAPAAGEPLEAEAVLQGLAQFKNLIEQQNCLYEIQASYEARVNHDTHEAELLYQIKHSPQVVFGKIELTGLQQVTPAYLDQKLRIQPGDCFSRKKLEQTRLMLLRTNLIASIDEQLSQPEEGQVDVVLALTERHHKTVRAGGGYSRDEGLFLSAGWEHRNLFESGQVLSIASRLSKPRQSLETRLTFPEFGEEAQKLELFSELANEDYDAYASKKFLNGAKLTRPLSPIRTLVYGVEFKFSEVTDDGDTDTYGLLYFPLSLKWDTTDDILDSRRGWTFNSQIIPYLDTLDTGTHFYKAILSGSAYHTLKRLPASPTLAMRVASGSLWGAGLADVPSDERYYVGGGGSIRGYRYQSLSALDAENHPNGGRSFSEVSLETRLHHGQHWGSVWFLDGGYAYEAKLPDWGQSLLWSAGVGVRYFTSFAPLRMDIAWPLDRRKGVDDIYQIYISLGQSF